MTHRYLLEHIRVIHLPFLKVLKSTALLQVMEKPCYFF